MDTLDSELHWFTVNNQLQSVAKVCLTQLCDMVQPKLYEAKPIEGHNGSVYALALNAQATLLAAGSTDGTIRISDIRSRTMVTLKGHTENVRYNSGLY